LCQLLGELSLGNFYRCPQIGDSQEHCGSEGAEKPVGRIGSRRFYAGGCDWATVL
jgi:hypothetical protein